MSYSMISTGLDNCRGCLRVRLLLVHFERTVHLKQLNERCMELPEPSCTWFGYKFGVISASMRVTACKWRGGCENVRRPSHVDALHSALLWWLRPRACLIFVPVHVVGDCRA